MTAAALSRRLRCRPRSSSFTMAATRPYTPTVMSRAMPASTATRVLKGLPATVPSAMTMISAERMKSVRTAPRIFWRSSATTSTCGLARAWARAWW